MTEGPIPTSYDLASHDEFLLAFETATLPKAAWTHAAHIYMAWCYLQRTRDWQTVLPIVREGINRLNEAHHNRHGYHETITIGFLRLIEDRLNDPRHSGTDWETFRQFNPDLFDNSSPVLLRYYQRDTLFSLTARRSWIEPDVQPLP